LKRLLGDRLKSLPPKSLKELLNQARFCVDTGVYLDLSSWVIEGIRSPQNNILTDNFGWKLLDTFCFNSFALLKRSKELSGFLYRFFDLSNWALLSNPEVLFSLYTRICKQDLFPRLKALLISEISSSANLQLTDNISYLIRLSLAGAKLHSQLISLGQRPRIDDFLTMQVEFVNCILSVPRISGYILQMKDILENMQWKDIFQAYYYIRSDAIYANNNYAESELYLFGNLWELCIKYFFMRVSIRELTPLLLTSAISTRLLSPSLLDDETTMDTNFDIEYLKKQIALFAQPMHVTQLFLKVFDADSQGFSDNFNPQAAQALCQIYDTFLNKCKETGYGQLISTGIIGCIAFNKEIIYRLWKFAETFADLNEFQHTSTLSSYMISREVADYIPVLSLFCIAYQQLLFITDVEDFQGNFSEGDLYMLADFFIKFSLKCLLGNLSDNFKHLSSNACRMLRVLHEFNIKKEFIPAENWLYDPRTIQELMSQFLAGNSDNILKIMTHLPFTLPFDARTLILKTELDKHKSPDNIFNPISITVRRTNLVEDGLDQLMRHSDIKGRIKVTFIDQFGREEVGIDGGGLFKEFWTSLSKEAFSPDYGLFCLTHDQYLYPNPDSEVYFGRNHLNFFKFLGRILGKAIFEGIVVNPQFAEFFLRKMVGKFNFLNELKSLDKEIYKQLIMLKNYEGNAEDLSLSFTANKNDGAEIELMENGREIPVTNSNKLSYIYKYAHYKLNLQIKPQCTAFFQGLFELIPKEILTMFTPSEMQILISGTSLGIDVEDLKANTKYSDCSESDKFIKYFWKAVESFTDEERALLLRFVTGCERAPLFGFQNLHPPFSIIRMRIDSDSERLPTASTCVNLLRLPQYSSQRVMREKLILAIKSGTGFELT
jgi:ubiquitin-protein ligase E3 C